jgi:hypothetical protein
LRGWCKRRKRTTCVSANGCCVSGSLPARVVGRWGGELSNRRGSQGEKGSVREALTLNAALRITIHLHLEPAAPNTQRGHRHHVHTDAARHRNLQASRHTNTSAQARSETDTHLETCAIGMPCEEMFSIVCVPGLHNVLSTCVLRVF